MPAPQSDPRPGVVAALAAALVSVYALALQLDVGGSTLSNVGQLAAATGAAVACWIRSNRESRRWRLSWRLFAAATGSWAVGQAFWTYAELSSADLPVPSPADVGYLGFPILALVGLMLLPVGPFHGNGRIRVMLDGTMVTASLLSLSWVLGLAGVAEQGAENLSVFLITMAYPVGDIVLITVAIIVLARAPERWELAVLVGGLAMMAVADSAFVYLTSTDSYATGALVDVAWTSAFLLIAVASATYPGQRPSGRARWVSSFTVALPYSLVAVGVLAMLFEPPGDNDVVEYATTISVAALMLRQLVVLVDNRRLLENVAAQQDELRRRAFHDELTGLANRALFNERVEHALALHRRSARTLSVLFCDLDDFKTVNDTLGHAAGDLLLVEVADRLLTITRPGDTVARLGGDEFAVLVEDDADAGGLAARMLDEVLAVPVRIADRDVPVRASIGVATLLASELTVDSQELVRRADVAMYSAKRNGKGTAVPYVHVAGAAPDHDLDLQLALGRDIAGGGMGAALQPVFGMDGDLRGYEALARWRYRDMPVPPNMFIPVAERAGLLPRLDMAVIEQAVARVALEPGDTFVSVNIGIRHLAAPGVVEMVAAAMARRGLSPHRLVVEVPEDRAIGDTAVMATLRDFRRLGVRLAMDDFGIGYSCLSRIEHIQPEIIKLDRSFVTPLDKPGQRTDVLAGIIDLAHRVGAEVIGEGVETQTQLDTLISLGCDGAQGYLLGRPEEIVAPPAPELKSRTVQLLERHTRRTV